MLNQTDGSGEGQGGNVDGTGKMVTVLIRQWYIHLSCYY